MLIHIEQTRDVIPILNISELTFSALANNIFTAYRQNIYFCQDRLRGLPDLGSRYISAMDEFHPAIYNLPNEVDPSELPIDQ